MSYVGRRGELPDPRSHGKKTKAEVHYVDQATRQHCRDCSMFRQGTCTLVAGEISAGGHCDEWEQKHGG